MKIILQKISNLQILNSVHALQINSLVNLFY